MQVQEGLIRDLNFATLGSESPSSVPALQQSSRALLLNQQLQRPFLLFVDLH